MISEYYKQKTIQFLKKHYIKIIIAIVLIFACGIIMSFINNSGKTEVLTEVTVKKGTIAAYISTTGEVVSEKYKFLTFGPSGIVKEIAVQEGDKVGTGTFLASLDTTAFNAEVQSAQGALQSSIANLSKVKDDSLIQTQQQSMKITDIDLNVAENNLDSTKEINKNNETKAQINVNINDKNISNLTDTLESTEDETDQAIIIARENEDIQTTLGPDYLDVAEGQTKMANLQQDSAIERIEGEQEIAGYQKDIAEVDLNSTKLSSNQSEVVAQSGLEKAKIGDIIDNIELNRLQKYQNYDVNALGGQLQQAQAQVNMANYNLEKAKLFSPFEGVVMNVPFEEGENYMPGASGAIEVADLNKLILNVEVNELDIPLIKLDQKVRVDFDALPEDIFTGHISKIYPAAIIREGVVGYRVDITFDTNEKIKYGMTANTDIITEERVNVLNIPLIAVEFEGDKTFVKVKKNNKVERKEIKIGIQTDIEAEIIEGLNEGDIVVY